MPTASKPTSANRLQQVLGPEMEKMRISVMQAVGDDLTPPDTPIRPAGGAIGDDEIRVSETELLARREAENELLIFTGELELGEEIGIGAWSRVFEAWEKPVKVPTVPSQSPLTPPASPAGVLSATRCFAIKVPSHTLALPVIKHEAHILSRLARCPDSSSYMVRMHGFSPATNSLVLSRASETLSNLASAALGAGRNIPAVRPSSDPVIGIRPWLDIASQLLRGLAWVHSMGVVHGDIKASNVLLAPSVSDSGTLCEESTYKALYCDFSSARLMKPHLGDAPAALPTDAITTSYASPELLKSYSRSFSSSNPADAAVATEASDVWALAVTLVMAAVGEDPYAHAGHNMRKLAMVKEGMVLDGVRMGEWTSGLRVKRGGVVERAVRSALAKKTEARIGIQAWVKEIEEIKMEVEGKVENAKV